MAIFNIDVYEVHIVAYTVEAETLEEAAKIALGGDVQGHMEYSHTDKVMGYLEGDTPQEIEGV